MTPQLTRDEATRVLEDIGDHVNADRDRKVWTPRAVRHFLTAFSHPLAAQDPDWCVEMFEDFCRERAVLGSSDATHEEMDAAEASADRLLGLLLGEPCGAAEYRHVGSHGDAA